MLSYDIFRAFNLKIILRYSGAEIMMGFEGQLGALDVWLNDTYTKEFNPNLPFLQQMSVFLSKMVFLDYDQFNERPWLANTMRAHKAHSTDTVKTHTSIMYGNTNYQALASMNSVTKVQQASFEELNPGLEFHWSSQDRFYAVCDAVSPVKYKLIINCINVQLPRHNRTFRGHSVFERLLKYFEQRYCGVNLF